MALDRESRPLADGNRSPWRTSRRVRARHGAMESERRHGRSRRRARLHAGISEGWSCYGYRFEAEGKVVAISGDTILLRRDRSSCPQDADVLVHCCYMASAEIENEHFRRVAQHTLAAGDTVGKIATRAECQDTRADPSPSAQGRTHTRRTRQRGRSRLLRTDHYRLGPDRYRCLMSDRRTGIEALGIARHHAIGNVSP